MDSLVEEPPSERSIPVTERFPDIRKERTLLKRLGKILSLFSSNGNGSLKHEMAELLEEHDPEGTQVSTEERLILNNVLALKDLRVEDVMIPRGDIVAVEASITLEGLKKVLLKERHTRLPVYRETLDQVIGFMHIKDLVPLIGSRRKFDITQLVRPIFVVPPSMKARDLLMRMRAKRSHIVVVVDEYGAVYGLVTLEDVMEEIVGNIDDEYDIEETQMCKDVSEGIYDVNARMEVRDLESKLATSLRLPDDEEDYDTVGGLVFLMLDRVPAKGEKIEHPAGFTFEVTDADARRIKRVLVSKVS
jgi:CBS domain containing-hemolysin-like protein